jgi:DNA-binding YbaB/EbfC family protein
MQFRGGLTEMMRQANRLQRKIEERKNELAAEVYEASAGNDQVQVKVNGKRELVSMTIAPGLLQSEDIAMVQDLIVAATNAALQKAQQSVEQELEKLTGGVKMPGML